MFVTMKNVNISKLPNSGDVPYANFISEIKVNASTCVKGKRDINLFVHWTEIRFTEASAVARPAVSPFVASKTDQPLVWARF